jgi:hypothetical protein
MRQVRCFFSFTVPVYQVAVMVFSFLFRSGPTDNFSLAIKLADSQAASKSFSRKHRYGFK